MKGNWKVIALLNAAMVYVPHVKIERQASAVIVVAGSVQLGAGRQLQRCFLLAELVAALTPYEALRIQIEPK
jgi:hypothetical protein